MNKAQQKRGKRDTHKEKECLAATMTDEVFGFVNGFLVWFFKGPKKIVIAY